LAAFSPENVPESGKDTANHDSATYRADIPHAIVNTGNQEAVVFLVVIYR